MAGKISVLYGVFAYTLFLCALLYAIGFVGNFAVPKSIDSGPVGPATESVAIDTLLLGLFALQHSVMARQGFKRWWQKLVPRPVERSTYVMAASLALMLLYWQWRPVPTLLWTIDEPFPVTLIDTAFWLGWGMLVLSTFLINHFELFGLAQVFAHWHGKALPQHKFHTPLLYRHMRHPIYTSFLIAFWATPAMSAGHLLFALATSGYILIAIQLEERDLIELFGDQYRRYRQQVGMLLPLPGRKGLGEE